MVIVALTKALKSLVKKPWLILPALIVSVIAIMLEMFTIETKYGLFFDLFIDERMPETTLLELPFRIIELYPTETLTLMLSLAIVFFLNIFIVLIYSKYVKTEKEEKNNTLINSTKYALSKITDAILLFILVALITLVFSLIYFLFIVFLPITSISWIVMVILVLIFIYVFLKLVFLVPAFVDAEDAKAFGKNLRKASGGIKQALESSWGFTQKHLLGTILLLLVLGLIYTVAATLIATIAEIIEAPEIALVVFYVLLAVVATFTNLSICYYYFENKK